jgi:hypothetical protein
MLTKGNIISDDKFDRRGIVLAVSRDGKRARVYLYGPDFEKWMNQDWLTVIVSGDDTCHKCGGSGVYQGGGMVLNGTFTGYTGECYACAGKGKQNDDDRIRCHHYWHRQSEIADRIEAAESGDTANTVENKPLTTGQDNTAKPKTRPLREVVRDRKALRSHAGSAVYVPKVTPEKVKEWDEAASRDDAPTLIDCPQCGALHRTDVLCPWQG